MDNFSVFGNDFKSCLAHLTKIMDVCVRKRLVLSWEKSHFMVREGVVIEHIVLDKVLEVDKADEAFYVVVKTHKRRSKKFYNSKLTMKKI